METLRLQPIQPAHQHQLQPRRSRHLTQLHQLQRFDTLASECGVSPSASDECCGCGTGCTSCYRAIARHCRSLVRCQHLHDSVAEQDRQLQKVIVSRYCAPHLADSRKIGSLIKALVLMRYEYHKDNLVVL